MDPISHLEARLAQAIADKDAETALQLRDALDRLRNGQSDLREQVPGRMGLGSSQERYVRAQAKPLPKKPDPMTRNYKPSGGSR